MNERHLRSADEIDPQEQLPSHPAWSGAVALVRAVIGGPRLASEAPARGSWPAAGHDYGEVIAVIAGRTAVPEVSPLARHLRIVGEL